MGSVKVSTIEERIQEYQDTIKKSGLGKSEPLSKVSRSSVWMNWDDKVKIGD